MLTIVREIASQIFFSAINLIHSFVIRKRMNKICRIIKNIKLNNLDSIFDFSYKFCNGLIKPMQIKEEFIELLKIVKREKPKNFLEIGTAFGGTLFCFCRILPQNSKIISIDLPNGYLGGGYPKWKLPIYKSFANKNQNLYLIRGNSRSKTVISIIKKILNNEKLDFVFIDGDHRYNLVKKDFYIYKNFCKKGSIIAFHDILPDTIRKTEVYKFWNEIKNQYKHKEIISNKNNKGFGIGLVYL